MKHYPTLEELRAYWAPRLQTALGENLLCAFAHGECMLPDFDPHKEPWQISFWLRSNQPTDLVALKGLVADPAQSGVRFGYFLTTELFENSTDVFPLEYLHMAKRHGTLCGTCALERFAPALPALRLELERELRGLLIHMRREFLYTLANPKLLPRFFSASLAQAMPLLYGAAYLFKQRYPGTHGEALQLVASQAGEGAALATVLTGLIPAQEAEAIGLANRYILDLQYLVQTIDQLETRP